MSDLLHVDLTPHEARALHFTAQMFDAVADRIAAEHPEFVTDSFPDGVPPLQSAAMKLEVALVAVREDL